MGPVRGPHGIVRAAASPPPTLRETGRGTRDGYRSAVCEAVADSTATTADAGLAANS